MTLDFSFASETKAIELFVGAYIPEYRLNHQHPATLFQHPALTIYSVLHPVGITWCSFVYQNKRDLPPRAFVVIRRTGIPHTIMLFIIVAALH